MFKLEWLNHGEWEQHSHPPVYAVEPRPGGHDRLVATAPGSDPLVLRQLSALLAPPFLLLFILHTPRGEGEPGRYQSPEMDQDDLLGFLDRFGDFLRDDARFDLWLHSPDDGATIVWDRHDLIHGYGPTEEMAAALRALGFHEGKPAIPEPHGHCYHAAYDEAARALLASMDWSWSPLHPEDEQ
jgi:hypothetical protein